MKKYCSWHYLDLPKSRFYVLYCIQISIYFLLISWIRSPSFLHLGCGEGSEGWRVRWKEEGQIIYICSFDIKKHQLILNFIYFIPFVLNHHWFWESCVVIVLILLRSYYRVSFPLLPPRILFTWLLRINPFSFLTSSWWIFFRLLLLIFIFGW